jgi:hypothetical protein
MKKFKELLKLTPEDVARFEREYLNRDDDERQRRRVCDHGFIYADGSYGRCHAACQSGMSYPHDPCYVKDGVSKLQIKACVNFIYGDVPEEMKAWLVDPKVSPWRDLMKQDFYALRTKHNNLCVIVGDLSHSSQFLTSYLKAGRGWSEHALHGAVANQLLKAGIHPALAFVFGQCFTADPNLKDAVTQQVVWHGGLFNYMSKKTLENFIQGKYEADREAPYGLGEYSYYGCDAIFCAGEDDFFHDFTSKYATQVTHQRAFGAPIEEVGWSITKIIDMCRQLEKEYGLETAHSGQQQEFAKRPAKASVPRRRPAGVRKHVGAKRLRANKVA